ncbi:MAG: nucleotidyl transferase AbiEii/AbiGii toxin family protein [Gammaproteobacteria bacterium]|nr:nucleotidyl transferase AbiEii/AbiGii toxin family protein [Gammaproteobacteria bacterium]
MIDLLRQRLAGYAAADARQEEQALREILQEVALYALWRADFFEVAAFQGGTCLRILQGLPRFSEDLDFILREPNPGFAWSPYFTTLVDVLAEFGVQGELVDRGKMDRAVRQALLKENSIGRQLDLSFYRGGGRKLKVKLEIDTAPPAGSGFAYRYLDFPLDFEVCTQDLASNFALKIHALLCRPWLKGRDWFDFGWYIRQGVSPNLPHLTAALRQYGPWRNMEEVVDQTWLDRVLREKIHSVDWREAVRDVEPFLPAAEQVSLRLWSERFFIDKVTLLVDCRINFDR